MTDFEFLLVNIYLLSIFTLMIKTKTISMIYRFLKILIVIMFVFLIVEAINEEVKIIMLLLVGLPLVLLVITCLRRCLYTSYLTQPYLSLLA